MQAGLSVAAFCCRYLPASRQKNAAGQPSGRRRRRVSRLGSDSEGSGWNFTANASNPDSGPTKPPQQQRRASVGSRALDDDGGSVVSAAAAPARAELAAMHAAAEGTAAEALRQSALDAMESALRILFVALQLLSFFNEALAVPWPEQAVGSVTWLQAFNFDGLSIPRISCLDPSSRYYASFHAKLAGTAAAVLLLAATSLMGVLLLVRLKDKIPSEEFAIRCVRVREREGERVSLSGSAEPQCSPAAPIAPPAPLMNQSSPHLPLSAGRNGSTCILSPGPCASYSSCTQSRAAR